MRKSESGFSLIEVLVSAFVLAFGVIVAIGMQLAALRTTQQSAFQSSALMLAADMADRMRANIARVQAADADNPYLQVDFQSGQTASHTEFDCYGAHADCDTVQMAQFDIGQWLTRIDRALPDARVRICRDTARGTEKSLDWHCDAASACAPVVIKIGWRDKESAASEDSNAAPRLNLVVASFST